MALQSVNSNSIERVKWNDALIRIGWKQSEHVTLIGPTGRGKTELTVKLLDESKRRYILFLGTKKKDETQDRLVKMGYRTIDNPIKINHEVAERYVLRPPFPRNASVAELKASHSDIFRAGLMRAFHQTGWCIAMDEALYICHFLGLGEEAKLLWLQGRSQKNAIICNVQRSRFIPLEAYSMASHLFMWTDPDLLNITRNTELTGFNKIAAIEAMKEMSKHDVLYVNTASGDMFITNTRW